MAADRREGAGEALAVAFEASPGAAAVAAAAAEDGCVARAPARFLGSAAPSGLFWRGLPVVSSPTGAQAAAQGVSSALGGALGQASSFSHEEEKGRRRRRRSGGEGTRRRSLSPSRRAPTPASPPP